MNWRELVIAMAAGVLLVLYVQQCGDTKAATTAQQAAITALDTVKADRDRVRSLWTEAERAVFVKDDTIARWKAKAETLATAGRRSARRADSLSAIVLAYQPPDTATTVPIDIYHTAVSALRDARDAYLNAESARAILADSVDAVRETSQRLLLAAGDSVKHHMARADSLDRVIRKGLEPQRCGWGPFEVLPCLTPKAAFVTGIVGTLGVVTYGDDVISFFKQRWKL